MKYCQKCGKQLVDEAIVCTGCGCSVAPFGKRGISLQKLDFRMTTKLLYVAEALVLISLFLILCSGSFWEVEREGIWYCSNSSKGCCSVCASHYSSFKDYDTNDFYDNFFELFQLFFFGGKNITLAVCGVVFLVLLGVCFVTCFFKILTNVNFLNKWWCGLIEIGMVGFFLIAFGGVTSKPHYNSVSRSHLPGCDPVGEIKWIFNPTGLCYFVIFLLLLAAALDISAKILYWKAKRQTKDIEENKTV